MDYWKKFRLLSYSVIAILALLSVAITVTKDESKSKPQTTESASAPASEAYDYMQSNDAAGTEVRRENKQYNLN